jgi:hypothetical protein
MDLGTKTLTWSFIGTGRYLHMPGYSFSITKPMEWPGVNTSFKEALNDGPYGSKHVGFQ